MNNKSPVQFHFLSACTLATRFRLKVFIVSIFKKEKQRLSRLSIIFCDDQYLLALNRQFLQHNYYTDILSFPLSDPKDALSAEIYISVDRVRENAKSAGLTFKEELHRVIFHGVLHFCGYKDKTARDIKEMRLAENRWLSKYYPISI